MSLETLKKALTQNFGLKLLALFFSIVLWLVVVNIDDPAKTKTFTTAVTITNEEVLTSAGKYYEVLGANTVSYRVKGKRSYIDKLTNSDFTVTADMNYLEQDENGNYRIPVEITPDKYANNLEVTSKQLYIKIIVEEETTDRFIIEGITIGEPALGYTVESIDVNPNVVTITGPAAEVERIATVRAVCDITDITTDLSESVVPVYLDAEGNAISTKNMTLSVETVEVRVDMVNIKDVSVKCEPAGQLAEGLVLESINCTPGSVSIKGEPSAVNNVSAIVIPESVIDLSTITTSQTITVDITAYLPKGVSLVDSTQATVSVAVTLQGQQSEVYEVPIKNIEVTGLASGLTASLTVDKVPVTVSGLSTDMAQLNAADITGSIDATGFTAGTYTAALAINLDGRYTVSPVTVTVEVIDPKAEKNDNAASGSDSASNSEKTESTSDKKTTEKTR